MNSTVFLHNLESFQMQLSTTNSDLPSYIVKCNMFITTFRRDFKRDVSACICNKFCHSEDGGSIYL